MSLHVFLYTFASSFITLFPVLNPIGNGFIVNDFLVGLDHSQRKAIVKKIATYCFLIGMGSLVVGKLILLLFNLAVPVIQLGGGILISKMGFDWLAAPAANTHSEGQDTIAKIDVREVEQKVFYPVSFPVCFGPGSISVVFTLMAGASVKDNLLATVINYLMIALAITLLCMILYVIFSQGGKLMSRLGRSENLIINKLVAFFTFCIGIQIVITGISSIFHLRVL